MSEKTVLQYLKQFIEFFKIIKQNNLVHCAFKPSNIFIRDGQFKTLSFSCNYDPFYQEQITTADPNYPVYDAPEIYRNRYQRNNHYGNFAKKADIWSLGVVMIEMLLG